MYIFQDLPVNTQNAKIKSLTPIHIKLHGSGTCPWYDTISMREKSENIAHFCLLFPVECSESIGPGPQSRGVERGGDLCTAFRQTHNYYNMLTHLSNDQCGGDGTFWPEPV